jgi:hypothetical protein
MGLLQSIFGSPTTDPLERALVAHAAGKGSLERVHEELRAAQVYILLEGRANRPGEAPPMNPYAASTPEGYTVVCAFTRPEHAVELQRSRPECLATMPVDFAWLMATLPTGQGVALNPGHQGCLFLAPESIDGLRGEIRLAA